MKNARVTFSETEFAVPEYSKTEAARLVYKADRAMADDITTTKGMAVEGQTRRLVSGNHRRQRVVVPRETVWEISQLSHSILSSFATSSTGCQKVCVRNFSVVRRFVKCAVITPGWRGN